MRKLALVISFLLSPLAACAENATDVHWTQIGPGGVAEERAVTRGHECRQSASGAAMSPRAQSTPDFLLVCSATVPADSPTLQHARNPHRIVVLGDTGCRIKPPALQDCNDPAKWPFPQLARTAASLKPDLVIHVGDYLYRESPCPAGNSGCAGTPWGNNWATWNADFFAPAAPLLDAAPWIFVRGNHEDCLRAGAGFLRLLGPAAFDPTKPCAEHIPAYAIPAGPMNFVVLDDASAPDTSVADTLVPALQADFASLASLAPAPQWLLLHRPIWGLVEGPLGIPVGGNLTMIKAVGDRSALSPVALMLAGHIHTFEAINYVANVPPQILAGHGGDNLDPTPLDLRGAKFQGNSGVAVKDGISVGGFGFLLMTTADQKDWTIDLYRADGTTEGQCLLAAGRVNCDTVARSEQK